VNKTQEPEPGSIRPRPT